MFRKPSFLLVLIFLLSSCTPRHHYRDIPDNYLEDVWLYPDSVLRQLEGKPSAPSDTLRSALCQLFRSIAKYRLSPTQPSEDLSACIELFRQSGEECYLFVAFVHQATISLHSGNHLQGQEFLQQAARILGSCCSPHALSLYHSLNGYLYRLSGAYALSLHHYQESQTINRTHGLWDWYISNSINVINLPGAVSPDSLSSFLGCYEPYLSSVSPVRRSKFYNNIGNYLKYHGDTLGSLRYYLRSIGSCPDSVFVRPRLNYAQLLDHYGLYAQADSVYSSLFHHPDSTVLHRVYRHLLTRAWNRQDIHLAVRHMQDYLSAIHEIYETRDRQELLEMQGKYEHSESLRQSEKNRHTLLQFLLFLSATLAVWYLVYLFTQVYYSYRLSLYLSEYCRLLLSYRQVCRTFRSSEEGYHALQREHEENMKELLSRIRALTQDNNRYRAIYRLPLFRNHHTIQDLQSLHYFLQMRSDGYRYDAGRDRTYLYHWLNLTDGRFVDRLSLDYPQLTPTDLDYCCFMRLGFSIQETGAMTGYQPDTIRRHLNKLYPIFGTPDKSAFSLFIMLY